MKLGHGIVVFHVCLRRDAGKGPILITPATKIDTKARDPRGRGPRVSRFGGLCALFQVDRRSRFSPFLRRLEAPTATAPAITRAVASDPPPLDSPTAQPDVPELLPPPP